MNSNVLLFVLKRIFSLAMCIYVCIFVKEQTKSQKTPEDKTKKAADARKELSQE